MGAQPPVGPPAPVLYWFEIMAVPQGGAPVEVRSEWLGVLLPVRHPRPIEGPDSKLGRDVLERARLNVISDGVVVEFDDALTALRLFGRDTAADWWEEWLRRDGRRAALVFRTWEGRLLPIGYAHRRFPELDGFGTSPD